MTRGSSMRSLNARGLWEFVAESNRIEGIARDTTEIEVMAHGAFLSLQRVSVTDMESFVAAIAPGRPLRRAEGMDVRVGTHLPVAGGPGVEEDLRLLLADIQAWELDPYEAHQQYERLHPFMDGNGRSGRMLWAWHMKQVDHDPFALPFLHRWYYQSLDAERAT